jgi:hypothetical protein
MRYYRLAGLDIGIEYENELIDQRLKPFQINPARKADMIVIIKEVDRIARPEGKQLLDTGQFLWMRKPGEDRIVIHTADAQDESKNILTMEVSPDWSRVDISIRKDHYVVREIAGDSCTDYCYQFTLCGIAFRNLLMNNEGLVIHSSSIAFRNKGILFTAPSGTGKSTHVRLWKETFGGGVTVVNDDTPAIRFINGVPVLFGTPWSGSPGIYTNTQVPLKAVVALERSDVNSIRKLGPLEALPILMTRSLLPYYDEELMTVACGLVERLLDRVDVYKLECRPDNEAVELVRRYIFD